MTGSKELIKEGISSIGDKGEESIAPVNEERYSKRDTASFNTAFISKKGIWEKNHNYFAFVESENYACWALADGHENSGGAAQLIVEEVMKNFLSEARFSGSYLRKIIKAAEKKFLGKQSKNPELKGQVTSLAVVLSNYNSVIIGYIGNVRIYHLANGLINYKSKDHSVAQLIFEANKMGEKELRFHTRRNDLTRALGTKKNQVHIEKIPMILDKGDALLIGSIGAWENLDEREVEVEYSKSQTASEWVVNLEKRMFSNGLREIGNYTLVAIDIDQVAEEEVAKRKKFNFKLIIASLLLLTALSYSVYKYYSVFTYEKEVYKKISVYEEQALGKLKDFDYELSIDFLMKAIKSHETLIEKNSSKNRVMKVIFGQELKVANSKEAIKGLNIRVNSIEKLSDTEESILEINNLIDNLDLDQASLLIEEVMLTYKSLTLEDNGKLVEILERELDNKVSIINELKKGLEYKEAGEEYIGEKKYEDALNAFNDAKIIFLKHGRIDMVDEMNKKTSFYSKERENMINEALLYENNAYDIEKKDPNESIELLNKAISIYKVLGNWTRVESLNDKVERVRSSVREDRKSAYDMINEAKILTTKDEFEKAIDLLMESSPILEKIDDKEGLDIVEVEMKEIKDAMNKKENINRAFSMELDATNFFINKEYDKAKTLYLQAIPLFETNKFPEKAEELKLRIKLLEGNKYEAMADREHLDNQLVKGIESYQKSLEYYNSYGDKSFVERVEKKLVTISDEFNLSIAIKSEEEGKGLYKSNQYKDAFDKLTESKYHYEKITDKNIVSDVYEKKIKELDKRIAKAKKKSEKTGWFW